MPKVIFAEDREVFHLMVYSRFPSEQTSPKRRHISDSSPSETSREEQKTASSMKTPHSV